MDTLWVQFQCSAVQLSRLVHIAVLRLEASVSAWTGTGRGEGRGEGMRVNVWGNGRGNEVVRMRW